MFLVLGFSNTRAILQVGLHVGARLSAGWGTLHVQDWLNHYLFYELLPIVFCNRYNINTFIVVCFFTLIVN